MSSASDRDKLKEALVPYMKECMLRHNIVMFMEHVLKFDGSSNQPWLLEDMLDNLEDAAYWLSCLALCSTDVLGESYEWLREVMNEVSEELHQQ